MCLECPVNETAMQRRTFASMITKFGNGLTVKGKASGPNAAVAKLVRKGGKCEFAAIANLMGHTPKADLQ